MKVTRKAEGNTSTLCSLFEIPLVIYVILRMYMVGAELLMHSDKRYFSTYVVFASSIKIQVCCKVVKKLNLKCPLNYKEHLQRLNIEIRKY